MIFELYTTKHWMIMPQFVHGILPTLMYNANNHIAIGVVEKKRPYLAVAGGSDVIRDAQVTEDGTVTPRYDNWDGSNLLAKMREPFVNVIPIDGPITRNGDACSYGSKEIRDWMMEAASNKFCRAHVVVVNTPGGSAWAKNDFQQAIDFAHENGQRVYMLIDGLCASAGMYLASFCDEVYVVNLKDQLGCVGVMASFFTLANGDKNQFNSETYHEYYATKSINKNKEYRDIAEDDDATLLIQELDELEAEFRADMQKSFPNVTDEHLDGKVFDASEVMGILCDGQMMLGDVVARAFAVADGSEEPIERTADRNVGQPEDVTDENPDEDPAGAANKDNVSPKNSTTMTNEKYQKIAQLLEVDELIVTEEGTFLNTPLLDKLSEKLEEMQAKANEPAAQAAEPAQEPAAEPAQEPASEPAQEPAAEPSGEGSQEPAAEPAQGPAAEPAAEPAQEPAAGEGTQEPAAEPAQEPAAEPASEQAVAEVCRAVGREFDAQIETAHACRPLLPQGAALAPSPGAERAQPPLPDGQVAHCVVASFDHDAGGVVWWLLIGFEGGVGHGDDGTGNVGGWTKRMPSVSVNAAGSVADAVSAVSGDGSVPSMMGSWPHDAMMAAAAMVRSGRRCFISFKMLLSV